MVKQSSSNKALSIIATLVLLAIISFVLIQSGGSANTPT